MQKDPIKYINNKTTPQRRGGFVFVIGKKTEEVVE